MIGLAQTPELSADALPDLLPSLVLPLILYALAISLWRGQLRRRLRPLPAPTPDPAIEPADGPSGLLTLFVTGWLTFELGLALLASKTGLALDELDTLITLQAGANLAAITLVLLAARPLAGGWRALGLLPRRPLLDLPAAVLTWFMLLPVLALCVVVNRATLEWLGLPVGAQEHLQLFLDQEGGASVWVWVGMVLVIPACEELIFRGAFFGGLRRAAPPWVAMLVSGLVFGAAHDPQVMLPVAALGVALAWLYERTGSLAAPILLHALQNAATLASATWFPEQLT